MRTTRLPRVLCPSLIAVAVVLAATPSLGQISPFRSSRSGPQLSPTDQDLLLAGSARLNRKPDVAVGAKDDWSNPATGSHGSAAVTRIFNSGGRACHGVHYEVYPQTVTTARTYDLTWCQVSHDTWKIKS